MNTCEIFDISPLVSGDAPIFPGDQPFELRWTARIAAGSAVNLSAVAMSPHVGAHADAPLHYADGAAAIDGVDLRDYLGPCRVIHAIDCGPLIGVEHLRHGEVGLPPRVLVRTCLRAATSWTADFSAYAPQTLDWLAERGVRLVGIDTPSVDPATSKSLQAHHVLLRRDMRVLENLVLDAVDEGDYELIALPLRLAGACASPVRAVLRRHPPIAPGRAPTQESA